MGCIWKLYLLSADEIPTKIKKIRISIQRIRTAMVKNESQMGEECMKKLFPNTMMRLQSQLIINYLYMIYINMIYILFK